MKKAETKETKKQKKVGRVGNPFKLSLKDHVSIMRNDIKVAAAEHEVNKNLRKIKKGKYEAYTQDDYDALMKALDTYEITKIINLDLTKSASEFLKKLKDEKLKEALQKELKNGRIDQESFDTIIKKENLSDDEKAMALVTLGISHGLVVTTVRMISDSDYKAPEMSEDDKKFCNGIVRFLFDSKYDKPFKDVKTAAINDTADVLSENCDFNNVNLLNFKFCKKMIDETIFKKIEDKNDETKGVSETVGADDLSMVVYGNSDITINPDGTINAPAEFVEPKDIFERGNTSEALNKYFTKLLGEEKSKSIEYFNDETNNLINAKIDGKIFVIDAGNILGFNLWSIMAFAPRMVTNQFGVFVNDTIMVPLFESETVKKIINNPMYILTQEEMDRAKKYYFENMSIYKYFDLTFTNAPVIAAYGEKERYELGKTLEKMLPLTRGYRFRIHTIESPESVYAVSDKSVSSPFSSNGETAMPYYDDKGIEISSKMIPDESKKTA